MAAACSSRVLSVPSLGLQLFPLGLSPLWPPLMLQKSTGSTVLLFSSSASGFFTWGLSRVAGVLQKQFPLLMMSSFFCIIAFLDETFPSLPFESWPILILPSENGFVRREDPSCSIQLRWCNYSLPVLLLPAAV